ncbi:MAG: hemerythrin domain-containing protein [Gammaproteobacteria bacterium]|nr:hemerythrin domain-containing protein [Gammaproteobacteria bacterium]MDH5653552.1 hemerythrin domain-containing protein [Gammaproteobacteria bacterium]
MMFAKILSNCGFGTVAEIPEQQQTIYSAHTEIPYNPQLIKELESENKLILAGFRLLQGKIKRRDSEGSRAILVDLKHALLNHFVKENVSLYVYIKAVNQHSPATTGLIQELKREMDGVQSMLFLFFSSYLHCDIGLEELEAMEQELGVITKVLQWRIRREEKELYPLYVAPNES